jgi:hypothetical protein
MDHPNASAGNFDCHSSDQPQSAFQGGYQQNKNVKFVENIKAWKLGRFEDTCMLLPLSAKTNQGCVIVPVRMTGGYNCSFDVELPEVTIPKNLRPDYKRDNNNMPTSTISNAIFSYLNVNAESLPNGADSLEEFYQRITNFEKSALEHLCNNKDKLPRDAQIKSSLELLTMNAKGLARRDDSGSFPPSLAVKFSVTDKAATLEEAFIQADISVDKIQPQTGKKVRMVYKTCKELREGLRVRLVVRLRYIWANSLSACGFAWYVVGMKIMNPEPEVKVIKFDDDDDQEDVDVVDGLEVPPPPVCASSSSVGIEDQDSDSVVYGNDDIEAEPPHKKPRISAPDLN